jgi:hypothetical protein
MGIENTYQRIASKYYWPKLHEDIKQFVRTCDECQKRKRGKEVAHLQPISISGAFEHIGIDVVGPLPRTIRGNRYIVVAIDYLTKWPEAKAIQLADALTIVPFIYEDVICRHGIPKRITTDQGTEFVNELTKELCEAYQIKHIRTTAYHPQANGLVERSNQTIKNTLAKLVATQKGEWDLYLSSALFAIRTSKQQTTRLTPANLTYGRELTQPCDMEWEKTPANLTCGRRLTKPCDMKWEKTKSDGDKNENDRQKLTVRMTTEITRLKQTREKATKFIRKAQERQKANYDKEYRDPAPLQIGDQVLLYRNITEASWSAKLEPKWEGPYIVHSIKGTTHQLKRPYTGTLLPFKIHRNRLKQYQSRK